AYRTAMAGDSAAVEPSAARLPQAEPGPPRDLARPEHLAVRLDDAGGGGADGPHGARLRGRTLGEPSRRLEAFRGGDGGRDRGALPRSDASVEVEIGRASCSAGQ